MDLSILNLSKAKITQFKRKKIETIEDLLRFLPKKYNDFRSVIPISQVKNGELASVIGKVLSINEGKNVIRVKIEDDKGYFMYIVWFHCDYIKKIIKIDNTYCFCGLININEEFFTKQMINPQYFSENLSEYLKIIPMYPKIKGMSENYLQNTINNALNINKQNDDYLEKNIIEDFDLLELNKAFEGIHQPRNIGIIEKAKNRLLFDRLFKFAYKLKEYHKENIKHCIPCLKNANTINPFIKSLDYSLTKDQLNITREIYKKMKRGERTASLIQGDVGCGKTIIAFILMLIASENNYQSALMCPTNVLAKQHYDQLKSIGNQMGYEVAFLSSELKAKEKKELLLRLRLGEIQMVVGTHAIISEGVEFSNLILSIIDEEHRFGVVQRDSLSRNIHNITMSATPIPRSLAMTIYGDNIDIYNITEMPKGRLPVKTQLLNNDSMGYNFMLQEVRNGRQCYVVCPLIEDSESYKMEGVLSVEQVFRNMSDFYRDKDVKLAIINGSMKQQDIDKEIEFFNKGETDIIISTTIIEVGINIPNATVMMIQNAERFGLAQLHQLRGRVGRGNFQSYCILISQNLDNPKLLAMIRTTDGFKIAEKDLKLRGAGDFLGTNQSGNFEDVMLMLAYPKLFKQIKNEIDEIFKNKSRIEFYEKKMKGEYFE